MTDDGIHVPGTTAGPHGDQVPAHSIDVRIDPRTGHRYIAVNGICNELVTSINHDLYIDEIVQILEDIDLRLLTSFLTWLDFEHLSQFKHHLQCCAVTLA